MTVAATAMSIFPTHESILFNPGSQGQSRCGHPCHAEWQHFGQAGEQACPVPAHAITCAVGCGHHGVPLFAHPLMRTGITPWVGL